MSFKLNDSLGFILTKVNTKLKNELFQQLKEYDVTPEQWAVLNCLWEQEGITPKELADMTFKDKPNTNRILEKLQMKELIFRTPHPLDKRAYQLFLTDRGIALRKELVPKVQKLLARVTAGLEAEKVKELKNMLNQIYHNMK